MITAQKFFDFYKKKANMDLIQVANKLNIKFDFSDAGQLRNSVLFMLQKPENDDYNNYEIVDDHEVLKNFLLRMQSIYKIIQDNPSIIDGINIKNDNVDERFLHIKLTYDYKERPYIKIDTLFCTNIGSLYTANDGVFKLELQSSQSNSQRYLFFDEDSNHISFKTKQKRSAFSDTLAYDGLSTYLIKDFPYPNLKEFSCLKEHREELVKLSKQNIEFLYRDGSGARINTTLTMEDLHQAGLKRKTSKRNIFKRKYSQFSEFSPLISDKDIERTPTTDLYYLFKVWLILDQKEWPRFYGWYRTHGRGKASIYDKVFNEVFNHPRRITEYDWLSSYYKDKSSDDERLTYKTTKFAMKLKNLKLFYKKIPANYKTLDLMLEDANKVRDVIEFRAAIRKLKQIIKKKENKKFNYSKVAMPNETKDVLEEFSQYKPITIHQCPKEILDLIKCDYTGNFDNLNYEINRQYANEERKHKQKTKDVPIFLSYNKDNQTLFCLCTLQVRYSGNDMDTKTHFNISTQYFTPDKASKDSIMEYKAKFEKIKSFIQNYIVDKYGYDVYLN